MQETENAPEQAEKNNVLPVMSDLYKQLEAQKKKPVNHNHAYRRTLRLYMRRAGAKTARRNRNITKCGACGLPFLAGASGRCQCKPALRRAEVA